MQPEIEDNDSAQKDGHFQNYAEYSKTLRAWFVAYGVGGPVLLLTNEKLANKVAFSGSARSIIYAFLAGVTFQVLLALINKWGAWHMYLGAGSEFIQSTRSYRLWHYINSRFGIDLTLDIGAFAAFALATWLVLQILLAPAIGNTVH